MVLPVSTIIQSSSGSEQIGRRALPRGNGETALIPAWVNRLSVSNGRRLHRGLGRGVSGRSINGAKHRHVAGFFVV